MLSTHNLRLLTPHVSQAPLCRLLTAHVPSNTISSLTVKIERRLWVDSYNSAPTWKEAQIAKEENAFLNKHGYFSERLSTLITQDTNIIDPSLPSLYLHLNTNQNNIKEYLTVTPAPCTGLFYETISREYKAHGSFASLNGLSSQQVETQSELMVAHGEMVAQQNGVLRVFKYPSDYLSVDSHKSVSTCSKNYVIFEFEIHKFNVATGLLGIGLPPITSFGIFISNYLQQYIGCDHEINFAIGINRLKSFKNDNHYKENHLRKVHLRAYLVIDAAHEHLEKIVTALNKTNKIAGYKLTTGRAYSSNSIPTAYWLKLMNNEVNAFLKGNPDKDVLDAAFKFVEEEKKMSLTPMGFALLEPPRINGLTGKLHSWAETLFKCATLEFGSYSDKYLLKKRSELETKGLYYWDHVQ